MLYTSYKWAVSLFGLLPCTNEVDMQHCVRRLAAAVSDCAVCTWGAWQSCWRIVWQHCVSLSWQQYYHDGITSQIPTDSFDNCILMHAHIKVASITAMVVVHYGRCANVTWDPKQPGQLQQQSGLFIGCGTLSNALFNQWKPVITQSHCRDRQRDRED